jgi:hypothetical protein
MGKIRPEELISNNLFEDLEWEEELKQSRKYARPKRQDKPLNLSATIEDYLRKHY